MNATLASRFLKVLFASSTHRSLSLPLELELWSRGKPRYLVAGNPEDTGRAKEHLQPDELLTTDLAASSADLAMPHDREMDSKSDNQVKSIVSVIKVDLSKTRQHKPASFEMNSGPDLTSPNSSY